MASSSASSASPLLMPIPAYAYEKGGVRLAFFTAQGGVSQAPYESLNCSYGSQDERDNVNENRRLVRLAMGAENASLVTLYQHHSSDVMVVEKAWSQNDAPKADGMVTTQKGIMLGILTADCGPILFVDEERAIIGAAHSGWRGTLLGVNENVIDAMVKKGAQLEAIKVFIGPMIGQTSYEVGEDVYAQVLNHHPENACFFIKGKAEGKYMFDLPSLIEKSLQRKGIKHILQLSMDTYQDEQRFFSYRRNYHRDISDYGRNICAIMIAE